MTKKQRSPAYDHRWRRLADRFHRDHPLCAECERRGWPVPGAVVDHIVPVLDAPERRLDETNLQALCASCHNRWKRRLEALARRLGAVERLEEWCKQPETRPPGYGIVRTGPMGGSHGSAKEPTRS